MENLYIIDAIGPFFKPNTTKTINWSKIPFSKLEKENRLSPEIQERILKDFDRFLHQANSLGYNAISVDDLPHLVVFDFYSDAVKETLSKFIGLYQKLFSIARQMDMKIFVNTDIMFYNSEIRHYLEENDIRSIEFLRSAVERCIETYPISGMIFRIGESDGMDVEGIFKSRLKLKTPKQVNECIHMLLPIFEKNDRSMIFRTWTVGVFPIGDLMWNKKTYDKTFGNIASPNFIVSMKYGDTDFYSGLDLNPLFFHGDHQKILELQTRREREGFGEFPYYVGWQYEIYARQLKDCRTLRGISVWCQTGGWTRWNNRTFLEHSSRWNELNTCAAIRIFKDDQSADSCIETFFGSKDRISFIKQYTRFFQEILYPQEALSRIFFFRRLRVPPCLWLFWDAVTLSSTILAFYRFIGISPPGITEKDLEELRDSGKEFGIEDVDYYIDSLKMLLQFRRAIHEPCAEEELIRISENFKKAYPNTFKFRIHSVERMPRFKILFFNLILRPKAAYRLIDRILLLPFVSRIVRHLLTKNPKNMPKFVNKRAMNMNLIFK